MPWDAFDPAAYIDHNYRSLRPDDEQILHVVRDHFCDHFGSPARRPRRTGEAVRGIDVGAGPNLYPGLAMLPWCEEITLLDRSAANVRYLHGQRPHYDAHWDPYWDVLCGHQAYGDLPEDPRARFRGVVTVEQGDLFQLGRQPARWSVGTMFFVAESMSASHEEFTAGVTGFLHALEPGAPFAAAFMAGSLGYAVGGLRFPACSIDEQDVREALLPHCDGTPAITAIDLADGPLRPGYGGMIVACGRRGRA